MSTSTQTCDHGTHAMTFSSKYDINNEENILFISYFHTITSVHSSVKTIVDDQHFNYAPRYESEYNICTKTRHKTPMMRTQSIVSVLASGGVILELEIRDLWFKLVLNFCIPGAPPARRSLA